MKKLFIFCILIELISISCQISSKKNVNQDAKKDLIRLNDYASELSQINYDNKDSMMKALSIINEVLKIDSTYIIAENNKLAILIKLKERNQALILIEKIISRDKYFVGNYVVKANILEKLNRKEEAQKEYLIASTLCEQQIKENPKNINLKTTLLLIHGLTQSPESVRAEYEALKKEYPTEPKIAVMDDLFLKFDREKYLELY